MEIKGKRELGFFPGIVKGPLVPYDYKTNSGARAMEIEWIEKGSLSDNLFSVYYNGGGYFADAEKYPNVKVLAVYKKEKLPAIVECEVKDGKAVLSGVHFEYDASLIKDDKYFENIIASLLQNNKKREKLLKMVFEHLSLKLKTN